jgi:hypothetical protein
MSMQPRVQPLQRQRNFQPESSVQFFRQPTAQTQIRARTHNVNQVIHRLEGVQTPIVPGFSTQSLSATSPLDSPRVSYVTAALHPPITVFGPSFVAAPATAGAAVGPSFVASLGRQESGGSVFDPFQPTGNFQMMRAVTLPSVPSTSNMPVYQNGLLTRSAVGQSRVLIPKISNGSGSIRLPVGHTNVTGAKSLQRQATAEVLSDNSSDSLFRQMTDGQLDRALSDTLSRQSTTNSIAQPGDGNGLHASYKVLKTADMAENEPTSKHSTVHVLLEDAETGSFEDVLTPPAREDMADNSLNSKNLQVTAVITSEQAAVVQKVSSHRGHHKVRLASVAAVLLGAAGCVAVALQRLS